MKLSRHGFLSVALATASAALLPPLAWAQAKIADVVYPNEVTVVGQKLLLNGYGMRFRFGFRGYTAALYTSSKVTKNEEVIKPALYKRIHMVAQRDLSGDELGKWFARGMEDNMSKEDFAKLINGVIRMGGIFAAGKQFKKGDEVLLDYIPGTGLITTFKGKTQGEPIKEPEFSENFFKIWFGKKPADEALRRALLGEQTTANTNVN